MIEKIKARWALYKEAWPYIRNPARILYLRDLTDAHRELIESYTAEAWKDEVVQSLKQELDARKAAMDEEERAHEQAEEELRRELEHTRVSYYSARDLHFTNLTVIAELRQQLAKAKSERAAALAEKACLLQEKADWLSERG